jgi:hypothetical protein
MVRTNIFLFACLFVCSCLFVWCFYSGWDDGAYYFVLFAFPQCVDADPYLSHFTSLHDTSKFNHAHDRRCAMLFSRTSLRDTPALIALHHDRHCATSHTYLSLTSLRDAPAFMTPTTGAVRCFLPESGKLKWELHDAGGGGVNVVVATNDGTRCVTD